jgi:hypothetical protein
MSRRWIFDKLELKSIHRNLHYLVSRTVLHIKSYHRFMICYILGWRARMQKFEERRSIGRTTARRLNSSFPWFRYESGKKATFMSIRLCFSLYKALPVEPKLYQRNSKAFTYYAVEDQIYLWNETEYELSMYYHDSLSSMCAACSTSKVFKVSPKSLFRRPWSPSQSLLPSNWDWK